LIGDKFVDVLVFSHLAGDRQRNQSVA
jgi:hypothetical protein